MNVDTTDKNEQCDSQKLTTKRCGKGKTIIMTVLRRGFTRCFAEEIVHEIACSFDNEAPTYDDS